MSDPTPAVHPEIVKMVATAICCRGPCRHLLAPRRNPVCAKDDWLREVDCILTALRPVMEQIARHAVQQQHDFMTGEHNDLDGLLPAAIVSAVLARPLEGK